MNCIVTIMAAASSNDRPKAKVGVTPMLKLNTAVSLDGNVRADIPTYGRRERNEPPNNVKML